MDETLQHANAQYERKDLRIGCIVAILLFVLGYLVVHFTVVWFIYHGGESYEEATKKSPYPLAIQASKVMPPAPRLEQLDRLENMNKDYVNQALMDDEALVKMEQRLHTTGPTDEKGFIHIPIEQAMKEVVGQLPVRKQPLETGSQHGVYDAGPSNSGRPVPGGKL